MHRWQLLFRAAFWAAFAVALAMALLPQPPQLPGDPPDKVLHVLAFLTLTALALAAHPKASRLRLAIALSAFGALIEILQMIPILNRDAQWLDWIADTGAVLAVLTVAAVLRRLQPR
jgi:VanZ family protein